MRLSQFGCAVLVFVGSGLSLGVAGCATGRSSKAHQTDVEREALVTVESIDVANRLVRVRNAAGASSTYYVDESVRTFPQAKVGDQVRVRYRESFALRLQKPGEEGAGLEVTEETSRPQPGQPSAKTTRQVKGTVRIDAVEQGGKKVTWTGPRGVRTAEIRDPSLRDYVKTLRPGDNVEVTYNEALALSLEPVAGAPSR